MHARPNTDHHPRTRASRRLTLVAGTLGALSLAGCSLAGTDDADTPDESSATSGAAAGEVVLITHDSFTLPDEVKAEFTAQTGYTLRVQPSGDAGSMTNQLALTKGSPLGDAVFGIDTTFASRAFDEGILAAYTPTDPPAGVAEHALEGELSAYLTPIDVGDVCVNIDTTWFADEGLAEPETLDDLIKPEYSGLMVTPGATTSSPGLAFLMATIAEFGEGEGSDGDGWQGYWKALVANDVLVTAGWEDAYLVDFTAGGGGGERPIVVSYASSPPFTIPEGGTEPTTRALMDTCFNQVEYAGVIEGAANPEGGQAAVDFLLSDEVQAALPESMFVFPVSEQVELPPQWAEFAKVAEDPYDLPAADIEANRLDWTTQWADIALR